MITDAALQAAAKEASLALVETLVQGSSQQPPYIPSKSFARKMSRLCRRERHPVFHRTMQRVAAVFLALLLTGIGWLSVDAEARAAVANWIYNVIGSSVIYRFLGSSAKPKIADCHVTWLPDGFKPENLYVDEQRFSGFYQYENVVIIIDVSLYHSGMVLSIYGDQENAEEFDFHGYVARYIPSDGTSSFNSLVWLDEDNGILFSIGSTLEKDVILHIADGIKLSK